MINFLTNVWTDPFKRYVLLGSFFLWVLLLVVNVGVPPTEHGELHFFYHPSCSHCHEAAPFLDGLEEKYAVTFVRHDTSSLEEIALLREMALERNASVEGVPTIVIGDAVILGFDEGRATLIEEALVSHLSGTIAPSSSTEVSLNAPIIGDVRQYSFPILAILLGLIDGFNPCAMWVLVYLISVIAAMNDKRRVWIIVGSFVAASGILYFLFMTAWLNAFLLIGYLRPVTLAIGVVAFALGLSSLKSFLEMKGPMVCDITDASSRRKTMNRIDRLATSPLTWVTLFGIIALAFVVNSIEFACSAALPAIFTQVLALSGISPVLHYLYIALYVLFFMLDDLIIFGLAAFAINTRFGDRYAKLCKLVGGLLLVVLGIILVFTPHLLR